MGQGDLDDLGPGGLEFGNAPPNSVENLGVAAGDFEALLRQSDRESRDLSS